MSAILSVILIITIFTVIMLVFSNENKDTSTQTPLMAIITVDDYQWLDGDQNPINISERFPGASLTRFYSPLAIFFQGWRSTPRDDIVDYTWDFGDDYPVFHGFNAAYVYERPGTYNVTLTIMNTIGNTNSTSISIEVLERDGTTYYVDSQLGNDSYDGTSQAHISGMQGPWRTADKVFSEMATDLYKPGDSILFNKGQIFELNVSGINPGVCPSWGYLIGAYGNGEKPIIQYGGENNTIIIHQYAIGLAHVSFVDLDFRFDDYNGHKAGVFFFAQGGGTRNILFLRVEALDLYSDLFCIGHYLERETGTGTFLVNSSIRNTYIDVNLSSTMFAVWASRFACLNNYFDLSGNHIGYTAIDKGVISGNNFSRPAFGRTALRICGFQEEGEDWNTNYTSNNIQVSDNYFHGWIDPETDERVHNGGGDRYNYLLVQLAPNGPWNQIIRDITFERNVITNGEMLLSIGAAENIIVRNNILISNNPEFTGTLIDIVSANKPCKNIKIIGNTLVARNVQYSGNIYEMNAMINVLNNSDVFPHPFGYSNHEEIYIKNNIFYINGTNQYSRFILIDDIDDVLPEIHCNNNLFYVSHGSNTGEFFQIGNAVQSEAQYLTLSQWQSETDQDLSSRFANPEFVDLLGPDGLFSEYGFDANLRLQQTSPARNMGYVDKLNSWFDFSFTQRLGPDSSVDVGAYEYSAIES
ncbi:MAG: PKD domain-containing protein [Candidatus Lokiarchaeota archaeon]|nr:PKD domain-containing protein [Candidatus Lokiarchaeota archaeon]